MRTQGPGGACCNFARHILHTRLAISSNSWAFLDVELRERPSCNRSSKALMLRWQAQKASAQALVQGTPRPDRQRCSVFLDLIGHGAAYS
eukprot:1160717-Pelagomonas_calceolata.AAC.6